MKKADLIEYIKEAFPDDADFCLSVDISPNVMTYPNGDKEHLGDGVFQYGMNAIIHGDLSIRFSTDKFNAKTSTEKRLLRLETVS